MELFRPFGPIFGKFKIDRSFIDSINAEVDNVPSSFTDHGKKLAGEVKQEMRFNEKSFAKLKIGETLFPIIRQYVAGAVNRDITKCSFLDCWIVRQKAHEYNPTHWHNGHISGVMWLKIPDNMTESGVKAALKGAKRNGNIGFPYGSRQFASSSYLEITPVVGDLVLFPHYLMHHVYPFDTEGERRSMAFNVVINEDAFNIFN